MDAGTVGTWWIICPESVGGWSEEFDSQGILLLQLLGLLLRGACLELEQQGPVVWLVAF